ncbi:MAG: hypothetical protein JWR36_453 [Glaciihabitans sp.]|nr:hypothetical protein [Glaciihabitans sp.]
MTQTRTVDQIRRRRRLLGWIPTAIGVLVIATVVTVTLVEQRQNPGVPAPAPTSDSRFDAKGLRAIERSRVTRINIATLPISAASVGLGPNKTVTIESAAGVDEYLQLEGNRTYAALTADSFRIVARDGFLSKILFAGQNVGGFPDLTAELQAASQFGLTGQVAQDALDEVRLHNHDGKPFTKVLGPFHELGVPVTVTVAADGAGSYAVNYEMSLGS